MTTRLLVADDGTITVESWPGNETGSCVKCQVACRKYGPDGSQLCTECQELQPRKTVPQKESQESRESQKIAIPAPREPEEEKELCLF